jgi:S1-C subfamily serine protease
MYFLDDTGKVFLVQGNREKFQLGSASLNQFETYKIVVVGSDGRPHLVDAPQPQYGQSNSGSELIYNEAADQELKRFWDAKSSGELPSTPIRLGVTFDDHYAGTGARVTEVQEGSPAAAHFKPNDVIVEIDGRPISKYEEVIRMVQAAPGEVRVTVERRDNDESERLTWTFRLRDRRR